MRMSSWTLFISIGYALALGGCVETGQVYAVRRIDPDHSPALLSNAPENLKYKRDVVYPDDQPLVFSSRSLVKGSFRAVAVDQCSALNMKNAQPGQTPATWAAANKFSYSCVSRIAAYTVDQCVALSLSQNRFSGTTKLLVGASLVAAALATDVSALSAPNEPNKTAVSALGIAVTANAAGIGGLVPPIVQPPVATIIATGNAYAEAAGISDFDFTGELASLTTVTVQDVTKVDSSLTAEAQVGTKKIKSTPMDKISPTTVDVSTTATASTTPPVDGRTMNVSFELGDALMMKLARTHDAMLSQCTADLYSARRVRGPKGIRITH